MRGKEKRGLANSTYYIGLDLGMTLGPLIGGALYGGLDIGLVLSGTDGDDAAGGSGVYRGGKKEEGKIRFRICFYLIAAQHDLKVVTLTALSKMLYLYYLTGKCDENKQ